MEFSLLRHWKMTISLLIGTSLLFFYEPSIDLSFSKLFFSKDFFIQSPLFSWSTHLVSGLVVIVCIGSLSAFIYASLKKKKSLWLATLFLMLCFSLGPGLVANGILKAYWGRPRPVHTSYFSGDLPYVPVWKKTNECTHNCSFVAGDSSAAFIFIAFAFLPGLKRFRKLIVLLTLIYFFYNAVLRIIHGSHYLSDVVVGALLMYCVILGCYTICYKYLSAYWDARHGIVSTKPSFNKSFDK